MAYRMSKMTVLRGTDYAKFKKKVKAAVTKHQGVLTHVAQDLDVGETTVKRWLREDEVLKHHIDRVREQVKKAAA